MNDMEQEAEEYNEESLNRMAMLVVTLVLLSFIAGPAIVCWVIKAIGSTI